MPKADAAFVPNMTGKVVIVTGSNSGIGFATAKVLAARGARVVLAVRDEQKGKEAAATMRGTTEVRKLDLASLVSIRSFVHSWESPIELLINNAGISSPSLQRTNDGFELQFGTNHLGPFALTNLLLPKVTGRVVTVGSLAEGMARLNLDDLNWDRTPYKEFSSYANSKLANLLFTAELQRRLTAVGSKVIANVAHPGLVSSNIYDEATSSIMRLVVRYMAQSPDMGALPVLYAAVADVPGNSFVGPKNFMHMRGGPELIKSSKAVKDESLSRHLWQASEEMTGVHFPLGSVTSRQNLQTAL